MPKSTTLLEGHIKIGMDQQRFDMVGNRLRQGSGSMMAIHPYEHPQSGADLARPQVVQGLFP